MDETILIEGKNFLISYLKGRKIAYEKLHPWRKSWEFIVLHSLRVESYVNKIIVGEGQSLTEEEVIILRLSAILHDIGRVHQREGHALIGRDIVREWLSNNKKISLSRRDSESLLSLIEKHSDKEDDTSDFCLKVLRDADILDEIGVMSTFMASSWIDRNNPYFFKLLSSRIEAFELTYCDKEYELLNTDTAKMIFDQKREFVALLNNQLKDELYGTEMFGEVNIEDYFEDRAR